MPHIIKYSDGCSNLSDNYNADTSNDNISKKFSYFRQNSKITTPSVLNTLELAITKSNSVTLSKENESQINKVSL